MNVNEPLLTPDPTPSHPPPPGRPAGAFGPAGRVLLLVSVLLPALLFALAAWQNRREVLREAVRRADRTAAVLHEHALKVFETHRLAIDQTNERLRAIDWEGARTDAALHRMLARLQGSLEQVATITVTDADGRMLASSRIFPAEPGVSFADRDWFEELQANAGALPYVSRAYAGRQSGQAVFNLAARVAGPDDAFRGVVAVSVSRAYFETFYRAVEPELDDTVTLVRGDGAILAREPATDLATLPLESGFLAGLRRQGAGRFDATSPVDRVERIVSYRKVGAYPVYVTFGVSRASILAEWRRNVLGYGVVALLSSLALLGVSGLAIRQSGRLEVAAARLQTEMAERGQVEAQLRQSQKMEAVGRLTGGVAHDFNNLLTVVKGSLDLLKRRMENADARQTRLIDAAIEGADRAAALTHRLLAFSRQQPLAPERIDANRLVAGMSDLLRRTLGEGVAVETVLAGGLWPTLADPNQLENALLNLAVNARDAMPDGGKLTIETANAHLDEAYAASRAEIQPGQYVALSVSDTGTGMPPEVMAKAFDPFFTTKPVGKGTGLGLSQVYGFARQSDGHAAIYSEPGEGTTIRLYLPRFRATGANPAAGIDPPPPAAIPPRARGETILVVEDERIVREVSAAALRDAGYKVIEAAEAAEGLDLLKAHPEVALLFTDVVLTGPMNGRHLADAAAALRPGLPVLFTTGYTRNAIIHHGRLDEGVNFLGKPFTAGTLAAKVGALLAAARADHATPAASSDAHGSMERTR